MLSLLFNSFGQNTADVKMLLPTSCIMFPKQVFVFPTSLCCMRFCINVTWLPCPFVPCNHMSSNPHLKPCRFGWTTRHKIWLLICKMWSWRFSSVPVAKRDWGSTNNYVYQQSGLVGSLNTLSLGWLGQYLLLWNKFYDLLMDLLITIYSRLCYLSVLNSEQFSKVLEA